jgi:hypothetical protein
MIGRDGSRIYYMWDPETNKVSRTSSVAWAKHGLIEAPSVIAPPATPGACIEAAQTSLAFMLGTVAWKDNKENLDHVSSQHIAEAVLKVFGPYATLIVAALAALYSQVCGRV